MIVGDHDANQRRGRPIRACRGIGVRHRGRRSAARSPPLRTQAKVVQPYRSVRAPSLARRRTARGYSAPTTLPNSGRARASGGPCRAGTGARSHTRVGPAVSGTDPSRRNFVQPLASFCEASLASWACLGVGRPLACVALSRSGSAAPARFRGLQAHRRETGHRVPHLVLAGPAAR